MILENEIFMFHEKQLEVNKDELMTSIKNVPVTLRTLKAKIASVNFRKEKTTPYRIYNK